MTPVVPSTSTVRVARRGRHRWPTALALAVGTAATFTLIVAIPTDLIDTPLFSRDVPPTWWAWPGLLASSMLSGLLAATYLRPGAAVCPREGSSRRGALAGVLTFLAVGCPVCNKLALLALGSAGAMTWFAPFQPLLQVAALALLVWALVRRNPLRGWAPPTPLARRTDES